MGKLTVEYGDLFQSGAPAIGHGVNTKGLMSSGIAVLFKNKFPRMHENYLLLCEMESFKPGTTWVVNEDGTLIFNIASQELPGANASYDYLRSALEDGLAKADRLGVRELALPQIGCGVGGLDWALVEPIIREAAEASNVHVRVILLP